jgi:DNA-binding NarL/FixJ family response regulator
MNAEQTLLALGVDQSMKRALTEICSRDRSIQFGGVTASISTLLFALEEAPAELVVLDEDALGRDAVSALSTIHKASATTRMLIIGEMLDASERWELLLLGVAGTLKRAEVHSQLRRAITTIRRGEFWFSRSQTSQLLSRLSADDMRQLGAVGPVASLTPQENRVLQECLVGQSNKEIARALGITEQTVKIHLQHIYRKLGVRRRADLLLRRWESGEKRGMCARRS